MVTEENVKRECEDEVTGTYESALPAHADEQSECVKETNKKVDQLKKE